MIFKKGEPKKLGMYLVLADGQLDLVRIVRDEGGQKSVECLRSDGRYVEQSFPASAKFSPRLRQAGGYTADERVEQSLDAKLRNANARIARLEHEKTGVRIFKTHEDVCIRPCVELSMGLHSTAGLVEALDAAGVKWKVDIQAPARMDFKEAWEKKYPDISALWQADRKRFDSDAAQWGWEMYKSAKGIN